MADKTTHCQNCGEMLRNGAEFCTKCGFSPSIDYTAVSDVPFIALAPVERLPVHKRIGRVLRLLLATAATVAVCMLAIAVAVLATTSAGQNPFVEIEDNIYESCIEMIEHVRGAKLGDDIMEQIVEDKGEAGGQNFREQYEEKYNALFNNDDDKTPEELYYVSAGYYTWFCEYYAKRYEYMAEHGGLYSFSYTDKAKEYRAYADWCYETYRKATSESELRSIVQYLEVRGIIADGTLSELETLAESLRIKNENADQ